MRFGASSRSMARPCRRPPAPQPGHPGPSVSSMPVEQVVDVWFGASFPMSGQALSPTDTVAIPVGLAAVSTLAVLGMDAPKVQTTSVKLSEFGVFWARWSAIWAHCGPDCDERGNGGHLWGPSSRGRTDDVQVWPDSVPGYVR